MRLRFTIRDLFWLTLVVGLIVGWFIDRRTVAIQRDESSKKVTDLEKLSGLQSEFIDLEQHMRLLQRTDPERPTIDDDARLKSLEVQIRELHRMGR
jgi:hypothetical protein